MQHPYREVGGNLMVNKQLELICHHIALYKMYGIVIQHSIYFTFYARKFIIAWIHNYHYKARFLLLFIIHYQNQCNFRGIL